MFTFSTFSFFFPPAFVKFSVSFLKTVFVPQIAIAIEVFTSNRGKGDEPLWRIGRGTRVPLQGAVDVVPLLGVIVGCHCSVLWLRRGGDHFWGSGRGALAGCYCRVPLLGGAIAGCHCSMLVEGKVTANFGGEGDDQFWGSGHGAIAGCQFLFYIFFLFSGPPISPRHPRKKQWILSWTSCKRYIVLYIDNTKIILAIWGLC